MNRFINSLDICYFLFFFFNDTATTEIYTLSLHDALPISSFVVMLFNFLKSTQNLTDPSFFRTRDRKSTRLNSSHVEISYAVFCLKKKKNNLLITYMGRALKDFFI